MAELQRIIEDMQLRPHMYANHTQIYGFCVPTEVSALEQRISACIDRVADWMCSNRLQLNAAKKLCDARRHVSKTSCQSRHFLSVLTL